MPESGESPVRQGRGALRSARRALTWAPGAASWAWGALPRLALKHCPGDNGGVIHTEDRTETKQSQVPACS